MGSPMVNVATSNGRGNRSVSPRCRLDVFERKLRDALGCDASRAVGLPGSDARPLSSDPRRFAVEYLIDSLMSKYDDGKGSKEKERVALDKFLEAEEVCYFRNLYFSQDNLWIAKSEPALERARALISELVGESMDLERIARGFGWGPGASTRLSRREGDPCYKYSGQPEVTPNAYALGTAAIWSNPLWKQGDLVETEPQIVWGSRLTTVPKNYKTDRTIAIEPDLNMYVQKGIGQFLRQKLTKVGIDLGCQKNNQDGARDPSLATVDFSMASDSVSQGLVKYLCPPNLVDLITQSRSEVVVMPDKTLLRLNKVSSMGNGFTFELETLIFWGLAAAVVPPEHRDRILVYGDDVLLPVEYAAEFIRVASVAGFKTNADKTFVSGPFRESCGIHIHSGYDVTPFYIRRKVDSLPELFLLHNNLRRWRDRVEQLLSPEQYDAVTKLCRELRNLAPAKWRKPRLPDNYGDGAFIGSFAECDPKLHTDGSGRQTGWEYFSVWIFTEKAEVKETEVPGLLVKSLTNLHKRRWVTPTITESVLSALPSSGGGHRVSKIALPWYAFG